MESEAVTNSSKRQTGRNVNRLICYRIASVAVSQGGGIGSAMAFLTDAGLVVRTAKEATEWVFAAIDTVKASPDCQWKSDEEIASEILKRIGDSTVSRRV